MSTQPSSIPSVPSTSTTTSSSAPTSSPSLTSTSSTAPPVSTTASSTSTSPTQSTSTTSATTSSSLSTSSTSTSSPSTNSSTTSNTNKNTGSTTSTGSSSTTFVTTSGGQVTTVTAVINNSAAAPTNTTSSSTRSSSSGFFHNTGAVAGVFAVVGLVALALVIWILIAVIRRRRAKQFDQDVAQAAAEAAASSHPADFDDYDYGNGGGPGGGIYGYSDNSNVALAQAHSNHEAYGMNEIGSTAYHNFGPDAGPGVVSNYPSYSATNVAGAGAAGIGAGGTFKSKSPEPYAAYAGPQDMSQQNLYNRDLASQNISAQDWNDPGRYGAAAAIPVGPSNSLTRNRSQGANTVLSSVSQTSEANTQQSHQPLIPESYASHYRQNLDSAGPQLQVRPPSTQSLDDPYGGITANYLDGDELPNPFASNSGRPTSGATDESFDVPHRPPGHEMRMSIQDDEDYGSGKRVLKVANE